MNKERLRELKQIIWKSHTFNMDGFFNYCGTPSCIAGHAIAEWGITDHDNPGYFRQFAEIMEIDNVNPLIMPDWLDVEGCADYIADRDTAIQALENVINGAITESEIWPVPYKESVNAQDYRGET